MSRRVSWFLLGFGIWSWIIWVTFARNLWDSQNAWDSDGSPTPYFIVHAILTVVSFVLGTIIGVLGLRGLRGQRTASTASTESTEPTRTPH